MKYRYKDVDYEIELGDDGTLDTIVIIDGIEHRLSSENRPSNNKHFIQWLLENAEDIIETDDRYW